MSQAWPPRQGVWVIAHRGASRDRPENTLSAFDEALRQGCHAIELDLQLTRDGVPVVYHDRTLSKIGGGRRPVRSATLEELRRLDAGTWYAPEYSGLRVPLLGQVLERYAGRTTLLLEIKPSGDGAWRSALLHTVVELVRRHRAEGRAWLLCFDPSVLEEARAGGSAMRRVLNVGRVPKPGATSARQLASADAVSVAVRGLTRSVLRGVNRAGLPLLTFTCNLRGQVERSLDAAAVGLMSDRPGWLRDYVERRGHER